jgi:hypothetical protein
MMAKETDTKLDANPMASAAVNPFLAFLGISGITISAPGFILGYFLKIRNLFIWLETPFE